MKTYVLDTSALLALRDEQPGADRVAELLGLAQARKCVCMACFSSLMELMYRVWRDEGEALAKLAYDQCLALPITWIHESPELLKAAAAIKAKHLLSLADAWIAATADLHRATLVHKVPEFAAVAVAQEVLPLKGTKPKKASAAARRS
jgi:predicted nucleic acid-binding protein